MSQVSNPCDLAIFLATSGHSGVDRIAQQLIPQLVNWGVRIDILKIRNHGPHIDLESDYIRIINLHSKHVNTSLLRVIHYLKTTPPQVILCDKDRVNRLAIIARRIAAAKTRLFVRFGTSVSDSLNDRSRVDRIIHYLSMHYLYPKADGIIVPSAHAASNLAEFANIDPRLISVLPNPVLTGDFADKSHAAIEHPWLVQKVEPVIVAVAELSKRKGIDSLLQAIAKLNQRRACRLLVLGRGSERQSLLELAAELGIEKHVAFLGFVGNPYPYMRQADVFVLSSRYEGLPTVLIEALATGTPVIATDSPGGSREILDSGRYGKLVPVDDHNALANAIFRTLDEPQHYDYKKAVKPYLVEDASAAYLATLGLAKQEFSNT